MKFNGIKANPGFLCFISLILLISLSHTFANSLIAGGWVPERHLLTVTPNPEAAPFAPGAATEVAILEIDNNLPEYELALEFSTGNDGRGSVSQVWFEEMDGTLGMGLEDAVGRELESGGAPGRFIWRPGRQGTATVNYRVRVMVRYAEEVAPPPRLLVSMPFAY